MGIPKFFRFISDRYPCISQIIKEHEIPKYDNLYIDMNSIIHACAHPADCDVHFRIGIKEFSDDDIYLNVSRYVELIFNIVKPKNLMFLAFDGVAPRAKMNQQRATRFRVARDVNKNIIKGENLNEEKLFDGNCITPGTTFMAGLVDHIKHFIAFKISTDPLWQKSKIILSGCEVPGEGEHKIMNFVRYNKAQSSYDPNTKHCLYSLDADLIMLGLCTHETHFSLIRENVAFGKSKRMLTPEQSDFNLLHLSVVRQYLEYEFASIKPKLKFEFDLEKIIDDWILIVFLVGNDFIPQLPYLHIINGALPFLYKVYINILPTLDGYINEAGHLNLNRFEKFIKSISVFEQKLYNLSEIKNQEKTEIFDLETIFKKLEIQSDKKKFPVVKQFKTPSVEIKKNKKGITKEQFQLYFSKDENQSFEEICSDVETEKIDHKMEYPKEDNDKLRSFKQEYYKNKLNIENGNEFHIKSLVEHYIKAIQWTLNYYYNGCSSWSWYYPYHYAPLVSDIKNIKNIIFEFDLGKPFLPLQHLMAVLPPTNKHLLPRPFHFLMTDSKSPIIDFYPENFEIDMNGKTNDWEALVLIPFIDETRLIEAMGPFNCKLNKKEQKRNTNGSTCVFTYSEISLGEYPVDIIDFGSFTNHAQLKYLKSEDMFLSEDKLVKNLRSKVSFELTFPAFPTLDYLPHTYNLELEKVENKNKFTERIILNVTNNSQVQIEELSKKLLGQNVFINWPFIREALVIGVSNMKNSVFLKNIWQKYSTDNIRCINLNESKRLPAIREELTSITKHYRKNLGINIGETEICIYVFPIIGKKDKIDPKNNVQLLKKYETSEIMFPYQLVIEKEKVKSLNFTVCKEISRIFTPFRTCFLVGQTNYGSLAKVKNLVQSPLKVTVTTQVLEDINFSVLTEDFFSPQIEYKSLGSLSKILNINGTIIKRITGSLRLYENSTDSDESKYYDIGLNMKCLKQNSLLLGYVKQTREKEKEFWTYSNKVIEILKIYKEKFSQLFENLEKNPKNSKYLLSDVLPHGSEEILLIMAWLEEQKNSYPIFTECNTETLGLDAVPKLEKHVSEFLSKIEEPKTIEIDVLPQLLFRPGTIIGLVPPDEKAQHYLLDRIICVRENFTVPLGLRGTIIGIQVKDSKWRNIYEVLFDSPFTGGLTLYNSSEHRCYRLSIADFINITHGKKNNQMITNNGKTNRPGVTNNKKSKLPRNSEINQNITNPNTEDNNNFVKKPKPLNIASSSNRNNQNNTEKEKNYNNRQVRKNFETSQTNKRPNKYNNKSMRNNNANKIKSSDFKETDSTKDSQTCKENLQDEARQKDSESNTKQEKQNSSNGDSGTLQVLSNHNQNNTEKEKNYNNRQVRKNFETSQTNKRPNKYNNKSMRNNNANKIKSSDFKETDSTKDSQTCKENLQVEESQKYNTPNSKQGARISNRNGFKQNYKHSEKPNISIKDTKNVKFSNHNQSYRVKKSVSKTNSCNRENSGKPKEDKKD